MLKIRSGNIFLLSLILLRSAFAQYADNHIPDETDGDPILLVGGSIKAGKSVGINLDALYKAALPLDLSYHRVNIKLGTMSNPVFNKNKNYIDVNVKYDVAANGLAGGLQMKNSATSFSATANGGLGLGFSSGLIRFSLQGGYRSYHQTIIDRLNTISIAAVRIDQKQGTRIILKPNQTPQNAIDQSPESFNTTRVEHRAGEYFKQSITGNIGGGNFMGSITLPLDNNALLDFSIEGSYMDSFYGDSSPKESATTTHGVKEEIIDGVKVENQMVIFENIVQEIDPSISVSKVDLLFTTGYRKGKIRIWLEGGYEKDIFDIKTHDLNQVLTNKNLNVAIGLHYTFDFRKK